MPARSNPNARPHRIVVWLDQFSLAFSASVEDFGTPESSISEKTWCFLKHFVPFKIVVHAAQTAKIVVPVAHIFLTFSQHLGTMRDRARLAFSGFSHCFCDRIVHRPKRLENTVTVGISIQETIRKSKHWTQ